MTEARVERRMMSEGARRPPVLTHVLAGIDHGGGGGAGVEGRGGPVDPVGSRRALHAGGGGGGMGPTHRKRELGWGYQLHCLFQVLSILQAEDTKRTWRSVGSIDETAQVKRPIRSIRATFQDCRASSAVWTTEEQIERPPNPWRIEVVNGRPNPAGASSGQRSHSQWRSWTGQRNAVVKSAFSRDQLESCLCALPAQSNTSDVGRAPLELPPLSGCPVLRLILGSRTRQHGRSCRLRSMTTLHQ